MDVVKTIQDYLLLFQQGDEKAFNFFFKTLYPALTMYAFKITGAKEAAEEIASGAFIKIWQKHERFSEEASIKAYLYRIVRAMMPLNTWANKNNSKRLIKKSSTSMAMSTRRIILIAL